MLKETYRILKYIYKNPQITKSELLAKFPDFEKYKSTIKPYTIKDDKNEDKEANAELKLIQEASAQHLSNINVEKYVKKNMPDVKNITDNSLICYSTNFVFEEYMERRRHEAWLFWFPYTITTIIAVISATPTIWKIICFICELFSKGTP